MIIFLRNIYSLFNIKMSKDAINNIPFRGFINRDVSTSINVPFKGVYHSITVIIRYCYLTDGIFKGRYKNGEVYRLIIRFHYKVNHPQYNPKRIYGSTIVPLKGTCHDNYPIVSTKEEMLEVDNIIIQKVIDILSQREFLK